MRPRVYEHLLVVCSNMMPSQLAALAVIFLSIFEGCEGFLVLTPQQLGPSATKGACVET